MPIAVRYELFLIKRWDPNLSLKVKVASVISDDDDDDDDDHDDDNDDDDDDDAQDYVQVITITMAI